MSVTLRPLAEADGPMVLTWRNSAEVAPYMYSDHVITPLEHARWLAAALTQGDRAFWIIGLDGVDVGLANLARIDAANRRCEWAYYLADPSTRGRGVGQAVELAMLSYVFDTLNLNKLWCEVLVENEAVWKLHERFGFVREAHYRDHVFKGGQAKDVYGLGLVAADWPAAKSAALQRFADKGLEPAKFVSSRRRP
jgi:UDP-4-amino-4,6-dideoxy-N-acetyl-beta-L-altrosamine N-acetyltransferase